jgi:hypothetical protein
MRRCDLCGRAYKARGLCSHHYEQWRQGRLEIEAPLLSTGAVVCSCSEPQPDPLGQCRRCGRLVVTFAHARRERFQTNWPEEWARAEATGAMPHGA